MIKILGICGSLRAHSSNAFLLQAAKNELSKYHWLDFNLADLPYFDADNQYSDKIPDKVLELRKLAVSANMIFISTPEYAHAMPGLLKNALEWLFHEGTQKKPVFVVIGSTEGESTKSQLIEVLSTMDFQINASQILIVRGARSKVDRQGKFLDLKTEQEFRQFCAKLF